MTETQAQSLNDALAAFTDCAARLEIEGMEQSVSADALLSAGLIIGRALQGPDATARILRQLAQRFTTEAVAEAAGEAMEPDNQAMFAACTAAAMTLKDQGYDQPQIAESMATYAVSLGVLNTGPQAWSEWLAHMSERVAEKSPAEPSTRH